MKADITERQEAASRASNGWGINNINVNKPSQSKKGKTKSKVKVKKDASGLENAEGANTAEPSVDDPRISRIASKLLKRKEFKGV